MTTKHLRYANTAVLVLAVGLLLLGILFENVLLVTAGFTGAMIGAALSLYIIEVYASILLEALMNQVELDQQDTVIKFNYTDDDSNNEGLR